MRLPRLPRGREDHSGSGVTVEPCLFLEAYAIRVQTWNHVVYLDGVVDSGLEIDTAESIARKVPDVTRVVNSIVVSSAR